MNKQEQDAAEAILTNLKDAGANDKVQLANAYLALMQGVGCRLDGERKNKQ